MGFLQLKSPFIFYADIGLAGSLVRTTEEGTEPGFVNLFYKPINSPRTVKLPFPVKSDYITYLKTKKRNVEGVQDEIMFIHTGEPDSLVESVLDTKAMKTIAELRDRIRSLELQMSSQKQTTQDAMSGAESMVARAKAISGGNNNRPGIFGSRIFGNQDGNENNEFDF